MEIRLMRFEISLYRFWKQFVKAQKICKFIAGKIEGKHKVSKMLVWISILSEQSFLWNE